MSREQRRGPPGPSPLLLIAGLPEATAKVAATTISNDSKTRWRAVASAFKNEDSAIYADSRSLTDLILQACEFAMSNTNDLDKIPNPSRIVLAFVVAEGAGKVWETFGHSAWPVPLAYKPHRQGISRHWRFDIDVVNRVLAQAIRSAEDEYAESMRLRLEARRTDDSLLLPARNFHLADGQLLVSRYEAFLRGDLAIADIDSEVRVERFPYERLAEFYRRTGGRGKRFAVDERGLVFAKSHHGQDGGHHVIEPNAEKTQSLLRRELESRFRFGTPLAPPGFQHDVQWSDGRKLIREKFNCTKKGEIIVSDDHANVFASDIVTAHHTRA